MLCQVTTHGGPFITGELSTRMMALARKPSGALYAIWRDGSEDHRNLGGQDALNAKEDVHVDGC